jgi:hypothetical protein
MVSDLSLFVLQANSKNGTTMAFSYVTSYTLMLLKILLWDVQQLIQWDTQNQAFGKASESWSSGSKKQRYTQKKLFRNSYAADDIHLRGMI